MEDFGQRIQITAIQFVPFLMAVIFHEFGHGFLASLWGDKTAKNSGRLTLNPIPHIDPIGTLLFPLINMLTGIPLLIGWAKPVPIDPRNFKKFRPGLFWVSSAGPGANFVLAFLSAIMFCVFERWLPQDFYLYEPLIAMTIASVQINYALGIFNLIPLPPLDGSKIIQSVLPIHLIQKYESISRYSFFILMALLMSGAFSVLHYPITFCTKATLYLMAKVFQLPGLGA